MLSDVIEVAYQNKPLNLDATYKMYFKTGDELVFTYTGHETFDANHQRIYSNLYVHLRKILSAS